MNALYVQERKLQIMRRRVRAMCQELGIASFPRRSMHSLCERLVYALGDYGIAEQDLKVAVRLYSRELAGRQRHETRV